MQGLRSDMHPRTARSWLPKCTKCMPTYRAQPRSSILAVAGHQPSRFSILQDRIYLQNLFLSCGLQGGCIGGIDSHCTEKCGIRGALPGACHRVAIKARNTVLKKHDLNEGRQRKEGSRTLRAMHVVVISKAAWNSHALATQEDSRSPS